MNVKFFFLCSIICANSQFPLSFESLDVAECNFPLSVHGLKCFLSALPLEHQLKQHKFYDAIVMIFYCVFMIATIVYLSPFHETEGSKRHKEGERRMEAHYSLGDCCLSVCLSLSLDF